METLSRESSPSIPSAPSNDSFSIQTPPTSASNAVRPSPLRRSFVGRSELIDPSNAAFLRRSKLINIHAGDSELSMSHSTKRGSQFVHPSTSPRHAGDAAEAAANPDAPRVSIYHKFNVTKRQSGFAKIGALTMTDEQKQVLRLLWESDFYATRINTSLKNVKDAEHLLPIELGGEDIYAKLKDGWILACFINRIPGYYGFMDTSTLSAPRRNTECKQQGDDAVEETKDLNHQKRNCVENSDALSNIEKVLSKIAELPIESTGVTVSHFEKLSKSSSRNAILNLLRQIVKLETVEILSQSLVEIGTIRSKKMKDSGLKRYDALEAFRQSGRKATVILNNGEDVHEVMIRKFINESLEKGEFSERLSDTVSLADGLYNSIIYTEVLNYIDPQASLEALQMGGDIIGKAQIVLDNAKKIGVETPFKSFHLAFGGDEIHFNFIATIAICAYLKELKKLETLLNATSPQSKTPRMAISSIFGKDGSLKRWPLDSIEEKVTEENSNQKELAAPKSAKRNKAPFLCWCSGN